MSTTLVDTAGLDRLTARFQRIANPNPVPLMLTWRLIMDEGNRRGVLAGTDGDGNPMAPVTYRPKTPGAKSVKLTVEQRLGQKPNIKRGRFANFGSSANGAYNNLSSAEYRLLDGPPLAPRRQFSRVITNFKTDHAELRPGIWACTFWWDDVLSSKGVPFLRFHFLGQRQKVRDLRGMRPDDVAKALKAMRNWMKSEIQSSG